MNDWFQAEFHAERAHQFYEAGQWHKALEELRLALSLDPSQSDWRLGMGLTLDALGRHDEAIPCFEEVLRHRPDDTDTMIHLAVDLIRTNECRRAVDLLATVSEIDPGSEPAYCHRVLAHAKLGEHDAAEQMFYLARQVTDECPLCYDHLAHSLALRNDLDRAVWCWQQTLRLDPHHPYANARLASVHWQAGRRDRAHRHFLRQLRQDPGDVTTLLRFSDLLIELGRHAEAREKLRRVLELDPAIPAAHRHLGELSLREGHLDAAAAELEMAARLDPFLPGIYLSLARVAQRRGHLEAARSHLRAELDLGDRSAAESLALAEVLIELRLPQPAIGLLDPLIHDASPLGLDTRDLIAALFHRGVASLLAGRTREGVRDCRRVLRLSPRHTLAMQNLIVAYLDQDRFHLAAYWLRRAQTLRPDDPQLRHLSYRLVRERFTAALRELWNRVVYPSSRRSRR